MTRLNYRKANQQRQMWRNGIERFYLPSMPRSNGQTNKRCRKRYKGTKSIIGSKAQLADSQQSMTLSVRQTNAQKRRAARRKARKLLAKQRKLERKGFGNNILGAANTASGQSVKQFAKLQKRKNSRISALANAKHYPRLENSVKPTSSRKSERKK